MLRYNKNESKLSTESVHRTRLMEKAIGKFSRKLDMMAEGKLPRDYILSTAAKYGLEVSDFSDKLSKYLAETATPSSEPESKVEKKSEKPQIKKKEVKASQPASDEKSEQSDPQ